MHCHQFRNYLLQSYYIVVSLICFFYQLILLLLHLDFSILVV
nr:MAG TPA: Phospholipid-transporting ATPase [Caudoviricetes sp.]